MSAPRRHLVRQGSADAAPCANATLAGIARPRDAAIVPRPVSGASTTCAPSEVLRPGPPSAGSPFCDPAALSGSTAPRITIGCARKPAHRRSKGFHKRGGALLCANKTTITRGSTRCASFFSSPFSCCRWPVACLIRSAAVAPALLQAPSSRTRPTATWSPVRRLAPWQGLQPAVSIWACRPVAHATDLIAATARRLIQFAASRGKPRLAFCMSAPQRA